MSCASPTMAKSRTLRATRRWNRWGAEVAQPRGCQHRRNQCSHRPGDYCGWKLYLRAGVCDWRHGGLSGQWQQTYACVQQNSTTAYGPGHCRALVPTSERASPPPASLRSPNLGGTIDRHKTDRHKKPRLTSAGKRVLMKRAHKAYETDTRFSIQ